MFAVVKCRDLQNIELEVSKPSEYQKDRYFCTIRGCGGQYVLVRTGPAQVLYAKGSSLRVRDRSHDLKWLKRFHDHIVGTLNTSVVFSKLMSNRRYVDVIKDDDVLYMQTINTEDVRCFGFSGSTFSWRSLETNDTVELMLYLRGVWWSSTMFGVSYTLIQLQRHDPIGMDTNLFLSLQLSPVSPPPPPPPPPPHPHPLSSVHFSDKSCIDINKNEQARYIPSGVVRPSLKEIIEKKEKLRITKYLS